MFMLRVYFTVGYGLGGFAALQERRRLGLPESAAPLGANDNYPATFTLSEPAAREVGGFDHDQVADAREIPLSAFGPGDLVEGEHGRWSFGPAMTEQRLLPIILSAVQERRARRAAEQAERERERAEREAESQRGRELNAAARAEREAKEESARAALRAWGEASGSPLLKARIAEGFEFAGLARQEFAESVIASLALPCAPVDPAVPEGYTAPERCDRTTPTLPEIESLRAARAACQGKPAHAELAWMKYEEDDSDDPYADAGEPLSRCELCVTVTCPDGSEREFWFHPAAEVNQPAQ